MSDDLIRCVKNFFDFFVVFFALDESSERKISCSALFRLVLELQVVGFVRTGSPAVAIA